jgi:hypothetical protein
MARAATLVLASMLIVHQVWSSAVRATLIRRDA